MNHWLVKTEPAMYAWEKLVKDGRGVWDGVRNYQARNNLKKMRIGDLVFFYHSVQGQEIMGIAKVSKEFYQDPTTEDPAWVVVEVVPVRPLKKPISLAQIKAHPKLQNIALVRQGRLSVSPLSESEYKTILTLE